MLVIHSSVSTTLTANNQGLAATTPRSRRLPAAVSVTELLLLLFSLLRAHVNWQIGVA